ncbi:MAG: transferase hexapeptide repeat family protein [Flavobacteriales bacterium]|tara:strand:+ start:10683 stop:11276 length:594 start_codon:yes stop_codon:yes gene_type:complete
MIFEFKGNKPVIDPSSFVHPQANVTGNVVIGKNVYIGPGAALRGDFGKIIIKDGANVQENCTIHMFPGVTVTINEGAHLGHGSIVHGATIGFNSMIGMNAVVLDDAIIGDECIVGALTLVKSEMVIPDRKVVAGNPAKIIKDVSDEMIAWKTEGTKIYQSLAKDCNTSLKETTPLTKPVEIESTDEKGYKTWKKTNN